MGTRIMYQTWDGGEGWNCPKHIIGYCVEPPFEVLKNVLLTHDVYQYLGLYRPIDYSFPNNVMGLIIDKYESCNGMTITGLLKDLDLSEAKTKTKRSKRQILDDLEFCRKWHTYDINIKKQEECWNLIDEIEKYVSNLA